VIRLGHAVHHGGGVLGHKVPGLVLGPRPGSLAVPITTVVGIEGSDTCQIRVWKKKRGIKGKGFQETGR
jgi:hypothetical protein